MSSYADLLKDRRWQQKRLEVLNAASWKCEACGSEDNNVQLHVHHKRYVRGRMPWEYDATELQALCKECHELSSETVRKLDAAIVALKESGDLRTIAEVAGYINARLVIDSEDDQDRLRLNSFEELCGAADAVGVCNIELERICGDLGLDAIQGAGINIKRICQEKRGEQWEAFRSKTWPRKEE